MRCSRSNRQIYSYVGLILCHSFLFLSIVKSLILLWTRYTQAYAHTDKRTSELCSVCDVAQVRTRAEISMNMAGAALSWIHKKVAFGLYICDDGARRRLCRPSSIKLRFHSERDYEYPKARRTHVDLDQLHVTHPKRPERRGFV